MNLRAVGQTFSPPTHAAIILSLEGVFAAIASYIVLGEILSVRELLGCSLMLAATCLAKVGLGSWDLTKRQKAKASHTGTLLSSPTRSINISNDLFEGSISNGPMIV